MPSVSETLIAGSIWITIFLAIAVLKKNQNEETKQFLFWGITIPIIFVSLILVGTTLQKNIQSVTRGPVHWHADFEIYACGERVTLRSPEGLANRIGNPVVHEHGDSRMHVEGTVKQFKDVAVEQFFKEIGGSASANHLTIPTNDGMVTWQNGQNCKNIPGIWQAFLYRPEGKNLIQTKLQDFSQHVLAPYSTIPPGDCIILEFGSPIKSRTDHMCNFYQIAVKKGELNYDP